MSSVLARYEVSGERRKPKPSGSTSSVPSPKIDSPFFACAFSIAKMRSCLRMRLAFSMPAVVAISTSCVTWSAFSSERCMPIAPVPGVDSVDSGRGDGWTASGCAACDLLIWGGAGIVRREIFLRLRSSCLPRRHIRRDCQQRVRCLDIAVKKCRQLRLRERTDARGLDIAVLEEHQRRDAADAELRRHHLVLVDVDLGDLQASAVLAGHLVQDRRDGLARSAPFGPVVHQHGGIGLQHFGLERVVGNMAYRGTAHGSFRGGLAEPPLWGRHSRFPSPLIKY